MSNSHLYSCFKRFCIDFWFSFANDPQTVIKLIHFSQALCGLPINTYFSAVKLRWLIDNCEAVKKAVEEDRCLFGTVDSWLIWVWNVLKYM